MEPKKPPDAEAQADEARRTSQRLRQMIETYIAKTEPVNENETVGSRVYCSVSVSCHRLNGSVNVNVDPVPI